MSNIPVVILCGGYGTRMKEETEYRPKPMVTIGNDPMLVHIMHIYQQYGMNKFMFPLGYKGQMIKDYFLNIDSYRDLCINIPPNIPACSGVYPGTRYLTKSKIDNVDLTFIDTGIDSQTGYRLKKLEKNIKEVSDTFMLTYGDGLADINIEKLLDFHKSHGKIATVTGVREPARFGEIDHVAGKVCKFNEKEGLDRKLINAGFFVFNTKVFDYIPENTTCMLELDPINKLVEDGELHVYQHKGKWANADTVRDIERLNSIYNKGEAFWIN